MSRKPNILMITTDEQRMDFLELYGESNVNTPNIKRLAEEGSSFSNMFAVSPLCMPSRASICSGLYPHNHGVTTNWDQFDPSKNLFFNTLKQNGYNIRVSGKLHFIHTFPWSKEGPQLIYNKQQAYSEYGIDELYLNEGKLSSLAQLDDYSSELYSENPELARSYLKDAFFVPNKVKTWPYKKEWHSDYRVAIKAIGMVKRWSDDSPEFLWLSFEGPHYPFNPPQEYVDRIPEDRHFSDIKLDRDIRNTFKGGEVPFDERTAEAKQRMCRYYAANVEMIDEVIGLVLSQLEEQNLMDKTLIIFTIDHGEALGDRGMIGKEILFYESIVRVPFILRFPGKIKSNYVSNRLAENIDITPTLFDLLNITFDEAAYPPLDGWSLKRDVSTETQLEASEPANNVSDSTDIYFSKKLKKWKASALPQRNYVVSEQEGNVMIRSTDGYKYVYHVEQSDEFFDLNRDPDEIENHIEDVKYTEQIKRMKDYLLEYFIRSSLQARSGYPVDLFPKKNSIWF